MWLARCHRRETKESEEWLRPRCAVMNFVTECQCQCQWCGSSELVVAPLG